MPVFIFKSNRQQAISVKAFRGIRRQVIFLAIFPAGNRRGPRARL